MLTANLPPAPTDTIGLTDEDGDEATEVPLIEAGALEAPYAESWGVTLPPFAVEVAAAAGMVGWTIISLVGFFLDSWDGDIPDAVAVAATDVFVLETGHTVVYKVRTSVVVAPTWQAVTDAAQDVIV